MCSDHTFFIVVKLDSRVVQREMLKSLVKEELKQIRLLRQSDSYELQERNVLVNKIIKLVRVKLKRDQLVQKRMRKQINYMNLTYTTSAHSLYSETVSI